MCPKRNNVHFLVNVASVICTQLATRRPYRTTRLVVETRTAVSSPRYLLDMPAYPKGNSVHFATSSVTAERAVVQNRLPDIANVGCELPPRENSHAKMQLTSRAFDQSTCDSI